MSFDTYCRECATHYADTFTKNQHVQVVHHGITPPNPDISEELFYTINSHIPQVRAKTCPVCLVYFHTLSSCVCHVDNHHPPQSRVGCLMRPTKEAVIYEWERLIEAVFPGSLKFIRKSWRIVRDENHQMMGDTEDEEEEGDDNFYDI
ncbi:hypothetical protein CAEBREN_01124 [Caenorhabditis brenneri]|uniref:C2H2-type domain-containing protein n=1 Tax=Caenorhabditis brenneri TaxID=135651 RepID=G0PG78_CAEBE|nr:hypothetical protein CAEBREN_01124 [Caenorhabditis brenneri]